MICARKSPHGSTFVVVLKRLDLARNGSKRMAHLRHTDGVNPFIETIWMGTLAVVGAHKALAFKNGSDCCEEFAFRFRFHNISVCTSAEGFLGDFKTLFCAHDENFGLTRVISNSASDF